MSKLVITDTEGRTYDFELGKERVSIGRQVGNDIVLADKAVSSRHAVIVSILADSFLEDLGSTNGTQVNGQTVMRHALAHGDVIVLGRNSLRFLGNPDAEPADDRTMILRPGRPFVPPSAAAPPVPSRPPVSRPNPGSLSASSLAAPGKPVLGKLRLSSGANLGRELELVKPLTTIGRPGVQVAAITRRADGYYIVQVGASTGKRLMLNGREIDDQPHKLNDQDQIDLAGTRMQYLRIG